MKKIITFALVLFLCNTIIGFGLQQDNKKALEYIKKATDLGDEDTQREYVATEMNL